MFSSLLVSFLLIKMFVLTIPQEVDNSDASNLQYLDPDD